MGLLRNRVTKRPMGLTRNVDAQSRLHLVYLPYIDNGKTRTVSYNTVQGQIAPLNPALKDALRTAWVDVDTLARADRNDNPEKLLPIHGEAALNRVPFNGMSDRERNAALLFLLANKGSVRVPGAPGIRLMSTSIEGNTATSPFLN